MGDCEYLATGGKVKKSWILFCSETTCVNLSDTATMAQLKLLLQARSAKPVAEHTTVWTPDDARALQLWAQASTANVAGWLQGDLYDVVGGQAVPNGNTVRGLLQEAGYPNSVDVYRYYPTLAHALDEFNRSECSIIHFKATVPPRGVVDAPPVVIADPEELPPELTEPGAMSMSEYVGYGLALAAVAGIVTLLWRDRRLRR